MNRKLFLTTVLLMSNAFLPAHAQTSEAYIIGKLNGRAGSCSEDARQNSYFLGAKTGCSGNTFAADVSIDNTKVTKNGDVATVQVNYSGKYTRDGWNEPCVKGGSETKNLYGVYTFTLTNVPYDKPIVNPQGFSNYGEVKDLSHDSNRLAACAVKNAVGF